MKRFQSRSEREEERVRKRNQIVISALLIFLMVFSTVGYFFTGSDTGTIKYNGHKIHAVVDANGLVQGYTTSVGGKDLSFYTQPADSLGIELPPGMISAMQHADAIVFVFDPLDNQTMLFDQLRFDFASTLDKQQGGALTRNSTTYPFPVVTCADASAQYPFILFQSGNRSVGYSNGCYTLTGTQYDFALLRDRLVYAYYGITEN